MGDAGSLFRSGKFWLLLGAGVVLGCCVFCGGGMFILMLLGKAAPTPVVVPLAPNVEPRTPGAGEEAPPAPEAPARDDFVFIGANGLTYVPELNIVSRGTEVKLVGRWRDDKQGFELLLASDNSYRCEETGSAGNSAAGSSPPLHLAVLAFTSKDKPLIMCDPGYEAGGMAARFVGSSVIKVPLTKSYSHDVKAMAAASPTAGLIYVVNPNNPTGTLTPREDTRVCRRCRINSWWT